MFQPLFLVYITTKKYYPIIKKNLIILCAFRKYIVIQGYCFSDISNFKEYRRVYVFYAKPDIPFRRERVSQNSYFQIYRLYLTYCIDSGWLEIRLDLAWKAEGGQCTRYIYTCTCICTRGTYTLGCHDLYPILFPFCLKNWGAQRCKKHQPLGW